MKLTDPWFEAEFYGNVLPGIRPGGEGGEFTMQGPQIEGAQGLFLWCPCGFGDPRYRTPDGGKPHGLIVPFANPRNAPPVPPDHGPKSATTPDGPRPRWQMSGAGLADLTLSPSVAVGHDPQCWHGWIQNGEVR
jgi:hypothetical protein